MHEIFYINNLGHDTHYNTSLEQWFIGIGSLVTEIISYHSQITFLPSFPTELVGQLRGGIDWIYRTIESRLRFLFQISSVFSAPWLGARIRTNNGKHFGHFLTDLFETQNQNADDTS